MQIKRKTWVENIAGAKPEHQIYLDESGINTNLTRHYARNHPLQSFVLTASKAAFTASGSSDAIRIFLFLRMDFIFDHIFSIGFKSGLYGGKYR